MKISFHRCEEIKRASVEMFVRCNVREIPIDPFMIASRMDIKIRKYSSYSPDKIHLIRKASEDGYFFEKYDGKCTILYNEDMIDGRIKYTIMHEIGHIILGHTEDRNMWEKEANLFAKFALAPPVLVHHLKLNNPGMISRVFGLSVEAGRNEWKYYNDWLSRPDLDYTDYEEKILELFSKNLNGGDEQ